MHYIFGYGSLICADSRARTGVSSAAHPIEVRGIERRWSLHSPEWPATALSAHSVASALCNGVYFAVDEENLARFDEREKGYDRIIVSWHEVTPLSEQQLPEQGILWAYTGKHTGMPSTSRPIMQSYLDVIVHGCLNYGDVFTHRFTELTKHWQHLVNDRDKPQYPRPLASTKPLHEIDQVLQTQLPALWQSRIKHTP